MHHNSVKLAKTVLYATGFGIYMGIGTAFVYKIFPGEKTFVLPYIYINRSVK
tara:strand:- start:2517 stop:2672 length:156 start_codon:yes stop_codon:yes gene_type:complete